MKDKVKGFIAGVLLCSIGLTTAYAAGHITSVEFNANKVVFNGVELDLSTDPMLSVVKEGETDARNYMPVRLVLEQMGFTVDWDAETNTVAIKDRELTATGQAVLDQMAEIYGNFTETEGYYFLEDVIVMLKESGLSDSMIATIVAEDYYAYTVDEESMLTELWEEMFSE